MATLVLTAIGTAVGGPIGGAVGALLGRAVDAATLFKPANREGPRLTELAVQTSSYGSAIPRLFGTMRVAGTVIWATDLIETRTSSGGGKGRPGTTSYSYSANFAVLLSGRTIAGIGRVWAEGTLIRGAAGDWKVTTGFRLHPGGEEQPVDPLIAAAEGTLAPAHRGCAYAVFEGLDLTSFGNRIPSLSFEVVAEAGPVNVGAIAMALGPIDADVLAEVDGFAAAGDSVAGALAALGEIGGAWWGPAGARIAMRDRAGVAATVADDGIAIGERGGRRRSVAALETVPRQVTVAHYDASRDYQRGVQAARRPGAGARVAHVEMPAVLGAAAARGIAEGVLARAEAARVRRVVATGFDAMGIAPGACVSIVGEAGTWRVVRASVEAMAVLLDLVPLAIVPAAAPTTGGRALPMPDRPVGVTVLHAFEILPVTDELLSAPRLSVVAAGTGAGWRGAGLLYSLDDGATWIGAGGTAAPAVLGSVETAGIRGSTRLLDEAAALVVRLARRDMVLGDADATALDRGVNLALAGNELLQFGRAEPLGGGRWRLTRLLRGRRGTEATVAVPGDRFVLIDAGATRAIELPPDAIGREVRVLASGVGDETAPAEARVLVTGASVVPPAPVHLRARSVGGALAIAWTRRSRGGWRWADGIDAPLAEEGEVYRVTVIGARNRIDREVVMTSLVLAPGELPIDATAVELRQRGTHGWSTPVRGEIIDG